MDQCTSDCVSKLSCIEGKVSGGCWDKMDAFNACIAGLSCDDFQTYMKNVGKGGDHPCKDEYDTYMSDCTKEEVESAYKGCP